MKDLILYILEKLVSKPDEIVIEESVKGNTLNYNVMVNPDDLGAVIGRGGKIANSIRTVVRSSAKKENKRVNISFE